MSSGIDNLKHIVVLMMAGRSFDHMLGFAQSAAWPIDGLKGNETNTDSAGGVAQVSNDADYVGDLIADPGNAEFDVLTQIYGDPTTSVTQNPSMSGFVRSYEGKNLSPQDAHRIMKCFSPQTLPVLTNLAQQFCVCDRWFSSLPGPTFPNRAFMHAATSIGRVDMGIDWRNLSTTTYERLNQNKLDAMIYYHDFTMASTFNGLAGNSDYFGSFNDDFIAACSDDDLPAYSFLEPRFANSAGDAGQPAYSASDQHAGHDVREGEALIQTVFNAVWGNAKVRNSTLLVIVYDEHGGFYDHVAPPTTVNPDGRIWAGSVNSVDPPFNFTRLGVRVPAVLISPYIAGGTIDSTVYDHTSIIATALKLLLPNVANANLTKRDAQANTFEKNLTLDIPRNDEITLGTGATSQPPTDALLAQPISDHLRAQILQAALLDEKLPPDQQSRIDPTRIRTEAQAAAYLQRVFANFYARSWRRPVAGFSEISPDEAGPATGAVSRASDVGTTSVAQSSGVYATPKVAPDSWSQVDTIGYQAYARTLAAVITHAETVPPLAIGIKASWGVGKTSLMKQVQHLLDGDADITEENRSAARIRKLPGQLTVKELLKTLDKEISIQPLVPKPTEDGKLYKIPPRVTVWFNAWKYQTSEQIWAGLAHSIISQVTARMDPRSSELFWLRLYARRVNKDAVRRKVYELALRDLMPLALKCLLVAVVAVAAVSLLPQLVPAIGLKLAWAKVAAPVLSLIPIVLKWRSKFGEKAADAYKELVREPNYEGKMGFLYLVESDIRDVLDLVATKESPLVIFIDDLDRCVPHRVAEVVEAINLSLSGDYPNCIFVLGMEPALVAAALEVANKEVIERLGQFPTFDGPRSLGWRFMEKIIQLPVIVPKPTRVGLSRFINSLLADVGLPGPENIPTFKAQPDPKKTQQWKEKIGSSATLDEVENVAEESLRTASAEERANIAEASKQVYAERLTDRDPSVAKFIQSIAPQIGGNPRHIKRYVNVFRFYLTLRYNLWIDSGAQGIWLKLPSPEALAKFIILIVQWPQGADFLRLTREGGTRGDRSSRTGSLLLLLEEKSRSLKGDGPKSDAEWLKFLKGEELFIGDWIGKRNFRQFLAGGESLADIEECGLW